MRRWWAGADTKFCLELCRAHFVEDARSHERCKHRAHWFGSAVCAGRSECHPSKCHEAICDISWPMAQETHGCRRGKAANRAPLSISLIPGVRGAIGSRLCLSDEFETFPD